MINERIIGGISYPDSSSVQPLTAALVRQKG
jgi:hypothetical protein